jgi:hypothetical protein
LRCLVLERGGDRREGDDSGCADLVHSDPDTVADRRGLCAAEAEEAEQGCQVDERGARVGQLLDRNGVPEASRLEVVLGLPAPVRLVLLRQAVKLRRAALLGVLQRLELGLRLIELGTGFRRTGGGRLGAVDQRVTELHPILVLGGADLGLELLDGRAPAPAPRPGSLARAARPLDGRA